jgi:hypothetical protein
MRMAAFDTCKLSYILPALKYSQGELVYCPGTVAELVCTVPEYMHELRQSCDSKWMTTVQQYVYNKYVLMPF